MTGMISYAQPLRAIGQALEALSLQSFELEPRGGDFYVRGTLARTNSELSSEGVTPDQLGVIWGKVPDFKSEERIPQAPQSASVLTSIELHYTTKDVDRLEQEGRLRRGESQRLPDVLSLSQVLRCVGAYLNQKRARLLKLRREGESVSVEYETTLGSQLKETLVTAELYDIWVRMYLQRAERTSQ
jgi:hypothetical protein